MRREDPKRLKKLVGHRIALARRARGLTQEALGYALGDISAQYVGMVERGAENLGIETMAKFANVLGVTVRDLFEPVDRLEAPKRGRPPGTK